MPFGDDQADRLVPRRMARRMLGFTGPQIADMEAEDQEAADQAQRQAQTAAAAGSDATRPVPS